MSDGIELAPVMQRFVLHWGEMGTRWGVNRTVAQVHALLYLAPRPLNAEEIAITLSVARSNVSVSLRELVSWGIVREVHLFGDRRVHFESMKDVWEMYMVVLEERKRREIDPTVAMLRQLLAETVLPPSYGGRQEGGSQQVHQPETKQRLEALLTFFEDVLAMYQEVRHMKPKELRRFVRMRGRVRKLLSMAPPA
jgi:DNA-binding transcriptional regulator GbsR (MarR family)